MTNFDTFYKTIYSFKENDTQNDIMILKQECGIEKTDKILDLWVGYGRVFFPLLEEGFDIYGYDNSEFFKENSFAKHQDRFIFGDFSEIDTKIEKDCFDHIYSLYSSIGHDGRENDEKLFAGISQILKKWGAFLLEYENFIYHSQYNNLVNKTFYDVWKYRRNISVEVDLQDEKIHIWNELYDVEDEKILKKWDFSLEFYTYKTLEAIANRYGLKLKKTFWRFDRNNVFWYEPQVFFLFEKI